MDKPIGGYFELELKRGGHFPHEDAVLVNSGRNAIQYILRALGEVKHVYVPYFTCDSAIEPIIILDIPHTFYKINEELRIAEDIQLNDGEYLIYTNYYGIMDDYCIELASKYRNRLIIDNAQGYFAKHIDGINTAYSPRKFVGLPDGGMAYSNKSVEVLEQDCSYDRCSHLLKRYDLGAGGGYEDFHTNSKKLHNLPIKKISELTFSILSGIDYESVKEKRRNNFKILHDALRTTNKLAPVIDSATYEVPLVYPYLSEEASLKKYLISNKIFVATYWPNVLEWCKESDIEYRLAQNVIAIPIDQRYGAGDMNRIIETIRNNG